MKTSETQEDSRSLASSVLARRLVILNTAAAVHPLAGSFSTFWHAAALLTPLGIGCMVFSIARIRLPAWLDVLEIYQGRYFTKKTKVHTAQNFEAARGGLGYLPIYV